MKKTIAFVVVFGLMLSVASVALDRTYAEEMQAVRDYLTVVDAKLATAKQNHNTRRVELLHVEKAATLARWNKLKASQPVAPVAVAPTPAPAPIVVAPVESEQYLFGLGLKTTLAAQFINDGKASSIYGLTGITSGLMANLVMDDFIGLGSNVQYKLGTGLFYMSGAGGLKAIPVYAGGIIHLPQWFGGQESYLTGGLNYVVYGNGLTSGRIGGDVYYGITADFGLGLGKTGFEIGYNVVRSSTVTSKGYSFSISQPINL